VAAAASLAELLNSDFYEGDELPKKANEIFTLTDTCKEALTLLDQRFQGAHKERRWAITAASARLRTARYLTLKGIAPTDSRLSPSLRQYFQLRAKAS